MKNLYGKSAGYKQGRAFFNSAGSFVVSFTLLKLPPQEPDLNPVENLWDVLELQIGITDKSADKSAIC